MKRYVVSDNRDILIRTCELAESVRSDHLAKERARNSGLAPSVEDLSWIDPEKCAEEYRNNPLRVFLSGLDDEQIKVIQTVMYIGRNYEVPAPSEEEWEEYCERKAEDPYYELPKVSLRVENPDAYLSEMIASLGATKGWGEKDVEVDVILGKVMVLSKYLTRAFEILGVR